MSKDILGSLTRALVTVPQDRLGLIQDIANKLAGDEGEEWHEHGKRFLRKEPTWAAELTQPAEQPMTPKDVDEQTGEWKQFYAEYFGLEDTEMLMLDAKIPDQKASFGQLIVVRRGLTLNQVFSVCQRKFQCWRYTEDLDVTITQNDRTPTTDYAIWIRDGRVEADEELKNLSANQLAEKQISGITLLERLLWELFYFWKTKKHLDIKNVTLCSGSRDSGGTVPSVYWGSGSRRMYVSWCSPSRSDSDLRARAVVS